MQLKSLIRTLAAVALVAGASTAAQAAAAYCNGAGGAAPLATTDVTFNTVASNDCYGVVDLKNQDPSTITSFANTTGLWTPNPWTFVVRDDNTTGNSGIGNYGGYAFTIAANNGSNGNPTPSAWTLTVSGSPIPFTMDFLVYMHAGSNSAYYYFDDRQINASNTGTFSITFTNNGGKFPGLSGLTILGRDINNKVSEPATLALVGLSLLGLSITRRRSRQR